MEWSRGNKCPHLPEEEQASSGPRAGQAGNPQRAWAAVRKACGRDVRQASTWQGRGLGDRGGRHGLSGPASQTRQGVKGWREVGAEAPPVPGRLAAHGPHARGPSLLLAARAPARPPSELGARQGRGPLTVSHDGHPHFGGPVARGGQDGAAVLGAFSDGVSQPAEHVGPAVGQRVGLRGDAHLQFSAVLLPDKVDVCGPWGHTDQLYPVAPGLPPRTTGVGTGGVEPPTPGASVVPAGPTVRGRTAFTPVLVSPEEACAPVTPGEEAGPHCPPPGSLLLHLRCSFKPKLGAVQHTLRPSGGTSPTECPVTVPWARRPFCTEGLCLGTPPPGPAPICDQNLYFRGGRPCLPRT